MQVSLLEKSGKTWNSQFLTSFVLEREPILSNMLYDPVLMKCCLDGRVIPVDEPCDTTTKPDIPECAANEFYPTCGSVCERSCENKNTFHELPCSKECVVGCFCRDNMVRDANENCIFDFECPSDGNGNDDNNNDDETTARGLESCEPPGFMTIYSAFDCNCPIFFILENCVAAEIATSKFDMRVVRQKTGLVVQLRSFYHGGNPVFGTKCWKF